MTLQNHSMTIVLGLASALVLMAGCASHDSAPSAPAGTTMGRTMTPAEIQASDQKRAMRGSQPASTPVRTAAPTQQTD